MRRRFSLVLTLVAWLLATGSHWDLVQTFAWGRMITTYSHSMPLLRAVEKTFAGDALCGVCELVRGAKQQDANNAQIPGSNAPEKTYLVSTSVVRVHASPAAACVGLIPVDAVLLSADRATPPLPPPRSVV